MGSRFSAGVAGMLALAVISACGQKDGLSEPAASATNPPGTVSSSISAPTEAAAPRSSPAGSTVPRCRTIEDISAPPELFRDEPVYVANEMPIDQVVAWAETKPGFEDLWIDRYHNGWLVVAFSEDAAARQGELAREFPDVGVVAVEVMHTQSEFLALQQRVQDALIRVPDFAGSSASVHRGVVEISFIFLTDEALAAVEPFAGEPVCVDGRSPSEREPERPQPTEGDGWRLLADELVGESYRTGVATDEAQYARLWSAVGLSGERPAVDFATEIVVWFGAVYGSDCPVRLYDVVVDGDRAMVHGDIDVVGYPPGCNDDANPHAFMVSIERSRLPHGPLAIQLNADDPPIGAPEERTLVDTDLSVPGAVATADQIGPDPELHEKAKKGNVETSPAIIENGYPFLYLIELTCGARSLGTINDYEWITDEAAGADDYVPDEWAPLATDGTIEVEILLTVNPPKITATAGGKAVEYRLADDADQPCRR